MSRRRVVAVLLATLLTLVAHPCLTPARSLPGEPAAGLPRDAAHHREGAALEPTGCEPEATAAPGPTSLDKWPAAGVATLTSAALGTGVGRPDPLDRPPGPVSRRPLFLLHAALLA